jgi:hypothetical protein
MKLMLLIGLTDRQTDSTQHTTDKEEDEDKQREEQR